MKNHIRVNGQLLQTNKSWGHLKQKQQEWIMRMAKQEYDRFVAERHKLPVHGSKQRLIERIYSIIEARGIWIPYGEVRRVLNAKIAHWNRVAPPIVKPDAEDTAREEQNTTMDERSDVSDESTEE